MTIVDAHIAAQARLRATVATRVAAAWRALPSYDERDVPAFLAAAVPVVRAGQRASVSLTDAYLAHQLGTRPIGIDPDQVISGLRAGAPADEVYRRPFVTVWSALSAGTAWSEAVRAGLERATSSAEMDVQLASRGTFAAAQGADTAIRGYRRVADPGACTFCQAVDGAFVKDGDAMPLHNRCGCTLEPLEMSGRPDKPPAEVAIHEHGELGPLLAAPGDHFTHL